MSQNQCGITVLLIFLIISTIPIALGATPLTTNQNRVLTYADNGTTISLEKGETFCLQLIENPNTGYSWQLNLSKGLKVVKEKIIQGSSRSVGDSLQQDVASLNSIPISGSSPISGIIVGASKTHTWII